MSELAADGVPVAVTCRVLKFAKQPYYRWLQDPVSLRDWDDAHLINAAIDVHGDDPAFGYRFIADELVEAGFTASERRVWRVCSENQIFSSFVRKRRGKNRLVGPPVRDDLVKREFTSNGPDRLWLTDISEHPTGEGKVYLCAVKDVWSNRIVGYSINDRMTSELAVSALRMAIQRRNPSGTTVHSDRGSQGGFNRSSQHLDSGGERWRRKTGLRRPAMRPRGFVGSGARIGLSGRRCVRPDGLRPRRRCSDSSGG